MTPHAGRALAVLAGDAVGDAVRRRIVPVIVVVSLLSLLLVDSCAGCTGGEVVIDGQPRELPQVAGWTGMVMYAVLALWSVVLAGVLASDHLVETLDDGSAPLALSRPVGRGVFALARLTGALAIALATAALLLGTTAFLLHARSGVDFAAAAWAGLAAAAGAVCVAALAMTASLGLPRIATTLLVLVAVATVTLANVLGQFEAELGPILGSIDRFGPPLCTALIVALAPWIEPVDVTGEPWAIALRLALWAAGACGVLVLAFTRREITR